MQGCENEVVILDLTITDPGKPNFLSNYRRLNVLMSRARSSLIILGSGKALLGFEWWRHQLHPHSSASSFHFNRHDVVDQNEQLCAALGEFVAKNDASYYRHPPPLCRLINSFPKSADRSLFTHVKIFRAFANSAASRHYPLTVVQLPHLHLCCPRHPPDSIDQLPRRSSLFIFAKLRFQQYVRFVKEMNQRRSMMRLSSDDVTFDGDEDLPSPVEESTWRVCRRRCAAECPTSKEHSCKEKCHPHASWFHKFGLPEYLCHEISEIPLSEYGCQHGRMYHRKCSAKDPRNFFRAILSDDSVESRSKWPCQESEERACAVCSLIFHPCCWQLCREKTFRQQIVCTSNSVFCIRSSREAPCIHIKAPCVVFSVLEESCRVNNLALRVATRSSCEDCLEEVDLSDKNESCLSQVVAQYSGSAPDQGQTGNRNAITQEHREKFKEQSDHPTKDEQNHEKQRGLLKKRDNSPLAQRTICERDGRRGNELGQDEAGSVTAQEWLCW